MQEERLSVDLQELTKLLESDEEVHTSLERLVELATTVVPACDGAAITVTSGERLETVAATGARAAELDRSQGQRGQGPVVEALTYGEPRGSTTAAASGAGRPTAATPRSWSSSAPSRSPCGWTGWRSRR